MRRTTLPSGFDAPPERFGTKRSPSPKASQWNTLLLVTLLVTLTKVWTAQNASSNDRARLKNFLHLVCAIRLVNRRVVDESIISAYERHLLAYLGSLLDLFPGYRLKPKHHYALHLVDCMRRFGPTIWYSSWSGERKIFGQKQTHTNHHPGMSFHYFSCMSHNHIGQMEQTMLRMEIMKTNLQLLLRSSTLPMLNHLHNLRQDSCQMPFTDNGFNVPRPKTMNTDNLSIETLSIETQETLRQYLGADHPGFKYTTFATILPWVEIRHRRYKPCRLSKKDSLIHFGAPNPISCNLYGRVGYIHEIFAWPASEPQTLLCIAVYGPPSTIADPFNDWPYCGAKLVGRNVEEYVIVYPDHVIEPIATCHWSTQDLVVISCPIS